MKVTLPTAPLTFNRVMRKLNHHRTTEVYFIGYPKTGNTWLRYMLGRYVQSICDLPDVPLFDATDRLGRCEIYPAGPAMQFTHRPLVWHNQTATDLVYENVIRPFRNKRVVLLVRHPLDTLVSHWMQQRMQRRTSSAKGYEGGLPEFLEHAVWGKEKFFRFYSLWFQNREKVRDLLLVRYEDMRADPQRILTQLLAFLDIPNKEALATQAVLAASFENMREIERSGDVPKYRSSGHSIFATGDVNNPDSFHVRRGQVGGFREYLDDQDVRRLASDIDRSLPGFFGYSTSSGNSMGS